MSNLHITPARAEELEKLEGLAIKTLTDTLSGNREVDDTVQIAMKTANMVAKNRVTMTARESIHFNMAQAVGDEKQVAKYVMVTQPQIKKALTGKAY